MAIIRIHDLKVKAIIGVHPWERTKKQPLLLNLTLEYSSTKAAKSDGLKDALDYDTLAQALAKTIQQSRFQLLEALAAKLLAKVMADKRVKRAVLRLDKPKAIAQARSVSVELEAKQP